MKRLIECVPNFSEGRDASKVDALVDVMRGGPGVFVVIDVSVRRHHFDRIGSGCLEVILGSKVAHHYRIGRFANGIEPPGRRRIIIG